MSANVINADTDLFVLSCNKSNKDSIVSSLSCIRIAFANVGNTVLSALQNNKIEIFVNNIVSSYSTRCHLNLRRIAMEGMHVEFKKENNVSVVRICLFVDSIFILLSRPSIPFFMAVTLLFHQKKQPAK